LKSQCGAHQQKSKRECVHSVESGFQANCCPVNSIAQSSLITGFWQY
jgi:hypothetical protein